MLQSGKVLIETLWNVKSVDADATGLRRVVLIETLWNVKKALHKKPHPALTRINRNIVECKDAFTVCHILLFFRINRNIVECKDLNV